MGFALIALLVAGGAAAWLLLRLARGRDEEGGQRSMTLLKMVVWLSLSAALLAAKLWPLAFMVLLAAVAVAAIEAWRGRAGPADLEEAPPSSSPPLAKRMTEEEALSILGLTRAADAAAIRAAHRKLIAQLHPDKGGTDYLASKINEARDLLLRLAEKD